MRATKHFGWLLIAGTALAAAPALTGCTAELRVVDTAPPPPRAELMVYRPGFVWVDGHWGRSRSGWRWHPGHYERERANMVYVNGRWERRGSSYLWIEGGWRRP